MVLRSLIAAALCAAALPCALARHAPAERGPTERGPTDRGPTDRAPIERFPVKLLVSPSSCAQPRWPAEARRYEIEGVTALTFEIGQDGVVRRPMVARGSGWNMLDHAAIYGLSGCAFQHHLGDQVRGKRFGIQYAWSFGGAPAAHPLLVQGSCQRSSLFAGFRNLDTTPSGADGLLVRMLIAANGQPSRVAAEARDQPEALVQQAVDYLKTCRFAIAPGTPGEPTDTLYGRVLFKPAR